MRLWRWRQTPHVERLGGLVANGAAHARGHATVVERRPSPSRPVVNVVLFLLTCVTTLLAGTAVTLVSVALLACFLPALRAMRVNPMEALHYE